MVLSMMKQNRNFSTLSFDYHREQMRILKQIEFNYLKQTIARKLTPIDNSAISETPSKNLNLQITNNLYSSKRKNRNGQKSSLSYKRITNPGEI
jgi:hypothetical protein